MVGAGEHFGEVTGVGFVRVVIEDGLEFASAGFESFLYFAPRQG